MVALNGQVVPAGDAKTIAVGLPPGFLGNPMATPGCAEQLEGPACARDTQVGITEPITQFGAGPEPYALHSVKAPFGYPAKFSFHPNLGFTINVVANLRSDEDYGITAELPNTPQLKWVYGTFLTAERGALGRSAAAPGGLRPHPASKLLLRRQAPQLYQRLLPGPEALHRRLPHLRPRHLQLRRRPPPQHRIGPQLPRTLRGSARARRYVLDLEISRTKALASSVAAGIIRKTVRLCS